MLSLIKAHLDLFLLSCQGGFRLLEAFFCSSYLKLPGTPIYRPLPHCDLSEVKQERKESWAGGWWERRIRSQESSARLTGIQHEENQAVLQFPGGKIRKEREAL